MTGELQRQNGNCSRAENAVDFRERDSRSIWRSELRRSCCRILLAGAGVLFVGEVPLSFRFRNPAFVGGLPTGKAFENSEAFFRKPFAEGGCVDLVTLE